MTFRGTGGAGYWLATVLIVACLASVPIAHGQDPSATKPSILDLNPIVAGSEFGGTDESLEDVLRIETGFVAEAGKQQGTLWITAHLAPGWHIQSIDQPPGGPLPTKIALASSGPYELTGEFKPDRAPLQRKEPLFKDTPFVRTYEETVTWTAPIRWSEGVDPARTPVKGSFDALACKNNCIPQELTFTAKLASKLPASAKAIDVSNAATESRQPSTNEKPAGPLTASLQPSGLHVVLTGQVSPQAVAPGGKLRLVIHAKPMGKYHVYPAAVHDVDLGSKPTLIVIDQPPGWSAAPVATPDHPPVTKAIAVSGKEPVSFHEGPVAWTLEIDVPSDAVAGQTEIGGFIGIHTCTDTNCDRPGGARFQTTVQVGEGPAQSTAATVLFASAAYRNAADLTASAVGDGALAGAGDANFDPDRLEIAEDAPASKTSALQAMVFAFLGGLILNLMPCVLPVIGLKILSFVEQSGQSRGRILLLNVYYTAGLMAVFMGLASLAVFLGFGWGQLFSYSAFNISLAAVVFAMGLSFLGVWEIPIPGFVGSGAAGDLAGREGLSGAFFKGVLTTVLATPCSGPFLGSALAWAVVQPPLLTYAVFASVGLGMASPYLLIGAFPQLVRKLPKPGAWMETFKQIMGFVLLGTVAYILTFVPWQEVVPTVALLFGVWAACWWIGRTPLTAELGPKLRAWGIGLVVVLLVWLFSFPGFEGLLPSSVAFSGLRQVMAYRFDRDVDREVSRAMAGGERTNEHKKSEFELAWQPYSTASLTELLSQGKTVMVDFTADWCLTCKLLEQQALNIESTKKQLESLNAVALKADWTHADPEVAEMFKKLGASGVPLVAIFPGSRPNQPIVYKEPFPYLVGKIGEALDKAGPSTSDAPTATAARIER